MTTPQVDEPKQADQAVEPVAEEQAAVVEPPLSPEEITERTAGGMARWLIGSTIAFWLFVAAMLFMGYRSPDISAGKVFLTFGVMIAILITKVILYFSVMLEPAVFSDRKVKLGLGLSFADLAVLTLIFSFIKLYIYPGNGHFTLLTILAAALIALSVAVLLYAFRTNKRFVFLLALAVLLASNLIPVGK